jgi:hypothetical protein
MVWCSRQDRMGDLPGLRAILLCQGLDWHPQKQIPPSVDSDSSGGGSSPLRMDRISFPA